MKNFEKYSSKKLEQYGSPVDTDKLWANVDTQLRPRHKKRWFFLLLLPAAGIAGLAYYFTLQPLMTLPSYATAVHQAASFDAVKKTAKMVASTPPKAENVISLNRQSTATSTFSQGKTEITRTTTLIPKSSTSVVYKKTTRPATLESQPSRPGPYSSEVTQEEPATNHTVQDGKSKEPVAKHDVQLVKQMDLVPELQQAVSPVQRPEEKNAISDHPPAIGRLSHTKPLLVHQTKAKLSKHPLDCYEWKPKSMKFFASIYGGLAYPIRQLEQKNEFYTRSFDKRNTTEDILESWHEGLTLGVAHRSGLAIEGGLHYQQINERFFWSRFLRDTIGTQVVITTIVHAPGDTTKFEENRPIVRETTTAIKRYNKYRFLSIPVSVSYERNTGRMLRPYIRAGAMINLIASQKATIFYGEAPQEFNSATKPRPSYYPFKTRVGVDLFGAIGVRASITQKISLFGEFRYQHPLYEITVSDYPIGQRYRLPGITVGGTYSF